MTTEYKLPEGSLISYMTTMAKKGGGVNLSQGVPGFDPPKELIEKLKKLADFNNHQYAAGNGDFKLVEQIAKHYNKDISNILVTNGATEAISLLYIYLNKLLGKFTSLSFDPVYESYKNLPDIFGNDFISFNLNDGKIDFEELKNCIEAENVKLIFLCSPGNPLGIVFSKDEMIKLKDLCIKNEIYLILDAVYRDIYFEEAPYFPIENSNEYIFYVNSFSKMLSITGWRVGYLISDEKHMNAIKGIHDYTGLSSPSILQKAIAEYLEESDFGKEYLQGIREKVKNSFSVMKDELYKLGFSMPSITGGYFAFAKLPESHTNGFLTSVDLYEKEKLAVVPGVHFSEQFNDYVRINVAVEMHLIEEAIEKLKNYFK